MRPNKDRQNLWLWAALLLPLLWLAAGLAQITEQAHGLSALAAGLTALLNDPLSLRWCSSTPKFLLAVLVLYPLGVYCYLLDQADRRPGEEHGSAHWGIAKELNERYRNRKDPWQEIILSQNIRLSNDSYQHQRNLHVVVIGGSGSGKTRFFVKPNALQCSASYFFLDPKGELTYSLGGAMEENGVTVTVIEMALPSRRNLTSLLVLSTRSWWLTALCEMPTTWAISLTQSSLSNSAYKILMRVESPKTRNNSAKSLSSRVPA